MRWLSLAEVLELHRRLMEQTGGLQGLRDLGLLEASLALPHQTFDGHDLYPGQIAKAAALGFSLIQNHPFVDGNKRIGHAAMEITLVLNGIELAASMDDAETVVVGGQWGYGPPILHPLGGGPSEPVSRQRPGGENAPLLGCSAFAPDRSAHSRPHPTNTRSL